MALTNLAILWETHDPQKAEAAYRQAIAVVKTRARLREIADYRLNLALDCTNLSLLVARDKKRGDEAARWRRQAIPHWQKLIDQDQQVLDIDSPGLTAFSTKPSMN